MDVTVKAGGNGVLGCLMGRLGQCGVDSLSSQFMSSPLSVAQFWGVLSILIYSE